MIQFHHIQLEILKKLLFSESLKYSELRPDEKIENNKLTFHIDRLLKDKLIIKNKDDRYELTQKGKEYANRMDTEQTKITVQGKRSTIQVPMRKGKDGEWELLLYTRKKHPFHGSQGFASGKVPFGEKTSDSAIRELKEETNLDHDKPELFMIEHQLVFDNKTKELVEDKYLYFYRFVEPKGEVITNEEGDFEWVKDSELEKYLTKPFETIEKKRYIVDKAKDFDAALTYEELEHHADNF